MTRPPLVRIWEYLRIVREILIETAAAPLGTTGDAATILLEAMRLHASLNTGVSFAEFYETTHREYYGMQAHRDFVFAGEGPNRMELSAMVELLQGAAEDCQTERATIERALAALAVSATPPVVDKTRQFLVDELKAVLTGQTSLDELTPAELAAQSETLDRLLSAQIDPDLTPAELEVQHQAMKAVSVRYHEQHRLREIEQERERAIDRQTNSYDHEKRYVAVAKWMIDHYVHIVAERRKHGKNVRQFPSGKRSLDVVKESLKALPCVGLVPADYSIEHAVNAMNILATWIDLAGAYHVDASIDPEIAWACPVGTCAECAAKRNWNPERPRVPIAAPLRPFPNVPCGQTHDEKWSR